MIFQNVQIRREDLPSIEAVEFQRLAPAYRNVEYIGTLFFFGILFVGWLLFFFLNTLKYAWLVWVILGLWGVLFAFNLYLASERYLRAGYALRERDIVHKYGVFWKTVTSIPFSRIQHCEISQGPVENTFGLATLRVFTAGGSSSDLAIEGLHHDEAARLKEFITQKIGAMEDQAEDPAFQQPTPDNESRTTDNN